MEKNGALRSSSKAPPTVSSSFASIFHDNIKSFISISRKNCAMCRVNAACAASAQRVDVLFFFFFSLSARSQVGWRGDKNGEQHYTDLSVGLVLRFFFAPFRERGRIAATTFYSHNLIISALWPGPPSSSGLEIRRPYNASHKSS